MSDAQIHCVSNVGWKALTKAYCSCIFFLIQTKSSNQTVLVNLCLDNRVALEQIIKVCEFHYHFIIVQIFSTAVKSTDQSWLGLIRGENRELTLQL